MLTLPLQICATRYYGVLTGSLPILHLRSMFLTGCSTVPCCPPVTTNMSATPPTPLSPTPAPESACPTPSSAARVGPRVQLPGGSATGGAWLGAGAASSPPAPGPPTGRLRAPPAPSSPWRSHRRGTAGHSAATWPHRRGRLLVSSAWRRTFPPPARISLELGAGPVVVYFWTSGDIVLCLARMQRRQQQQKQHQQQRTAVWVEQSCPRIILQIMTTIMLMYGHWSLQRDTSYS